MCFFFSILEYARNYDGRGIPAPWRINPQDVSATTKVLMFQLLQKYIYINVFGGVGKEKEILFTCSTRQN